MAGPVDFNTSDWRGLGYQNCVQNCKTGHQSLPSSLPRQPDGGMNLLPSSCFSTGTRTHWWPWHERGRNFCQAIRGMKLSRTEEEFIAETY